MIIFFVYIDRHGKQHFSYKLVEDERSQRAPVFYSFGNHNSYQQIICLEKDSDISYRFRDEEGELSLEEMIRSQLNSTGNNFYFKNPFLDGISIGEKSDIKELIKMDPILLKVYLDNLKSQKQ